MSLELLDKTVLRGNPVPMESKELLVRLVPRENRVQLVMLVIEVQRVKRDLLVSPVKMELLVSPVMPVLSAKTVLPVRMVPTENLVLMELREHPARTESSTLRENLVIKAPRDLREMSVTPEPKVNRVLLEIRDLMVKMDQMAKMVPMVMLVNLVTKDPMVLLESMA